MKGPILCVDVIVEKADKILLVTRKMNPFEGKLALPGGKVWGGETVEHTAIREVKAESGVEIKLLDILGVYSNPKRDPRAHYTTIVFIATANDMKTKAGPDMTAAQWFDTDSIKKEYMAFDHFRMLEDYIKWKENKGTYWSSKNG